MATITPVTVTVTATSPTAETDPRPVASLRKVTLGVAVVAAVATTVLAAALHAAGVTFEIDGEAIPILGFAQMTLMWTLVGGVLAGSIRKRSAHPHRRFIQATVALTAVSCIPSIAYPSSVGTKAALVVTHLVAAVIVIPVLARRLADGPS